MFCVHCPWLQTTMNMYSSVCYVRLVIYSIMYWFHCNLFEKDTCKKLIVTYWATFTLTMTNNVYKLFFFCTCQYMLECLGILLFWQEDTGQVLHTVITSVRILRYHPSDNLFYVLQNLPNTYLRALFPCSGYCIDSVLSRWN